MNTVSWGGLRLYVVSASTPIGRSVVVQSPARGDRHPTSDRGADPRNFDAELVFADIPTETEDKEARYLRFLALIDGTPRMLVHPLHGAYLARVRNARLEQSNDSDALRVSAEFLPDEPVQPSLPIGPGAAPIAGPEAVNTAADDFTAELDALELTSNAPGNTAATVTAWSTENPDDLPAARVEQELAERSAQLDEEIEELELQSLEAWSAFRAAMILRDRLRDAAAAVVRPTPRLYSKTVEVGAALQVLLNHEYGATEAARQKPAVIELNAIRNPAFIPAGTVLKLPVVTRGR